MNYFHTRKGQKRGCNTSGRVLRNLLYGLAVGRLIHQLRAGD